MSLAVKISLFCAGLFLTALYGGQLRLGVNALPEGTGYLTAALFDRTEAAFGSLASTAKAALA